MIPQGIKLCESLCLASRRICRILAMIRGVAHKFWLDGCMAAPARNQGPPVRWTGAGLGSGWRCRAPFALLAAEAEAA